jgi:N-acetylmuramoyl-L-alanine amidase
MVTRAQAVTWLKAQIGKYLDYDHQYGAQCVDFFNFYYKYITGGRSPYADGYTVVGAKNLWWVPTDKFIKIPDSPSLWPKPGDVLIYGSTWGGGYGHVEVCLSSDAYGSWVVGENEYGNPWQGTVKVYRTWKQMYGLTGAMRPRFPS